MSPKSADRSRQSTILALAICGSLIAWAVSQFTHEHFNAVALLVAALSVYYLAGRFYSAFVANRVLNLDDAKVTPAHRLRDDRDYMPFRRWTLFGMHFAWIAGPDGAIMGLFRRDGEQEWRLPPVGGHKVD